MRENNGVKSKITENAGQGSIERGGGMAGKSVDQSQQRGAFKVEGSDEHQRIEMKDNGGVGGEVTHNKRLGTEKDMGGVGDY
jgi:hypothetical protein